MATFNQFEANRLNAQKSTGPRTPAGKEASRFNALKHGIDARHTIIPGENQADLERLANEYQDQLRPETSSNATSSIPSSVATGSAAGCTARRPTSTTSWPSAPTS